MTKTIILSSNKSLPSCRMLRDELNNLFNSSIIITCNPDKIRDRKLILRYGNSLGDENSVPNKKEFIGLCSHKLRFSKLMKENNIYSPIFYKGTPKEFPVLIRQTLTGQHGQGIVLCLNEEEFNNNSGSNFFWTPFISLEYELRVHILGGELKKVFTKKWIGESCPKYPIRNSNNCHFSNSVITESNYLKLKELIKKLDFFLTKDSFVALDVGYDNIKKEYLILEGNSAPGLNSLTVKDYAEFIYSCVGNKNVGGEMT